MFHFFGRVGDICFVIWVNSETPYMNFAYPCKCVPWSSCFVFMMRTVTPLKIGICVLLENLSSASENFDIPVSLSERAKMQDPRSFHSHLQALIYLCDSPWRQRQHVEQACHDIGSAGGWLQQEDRKWNVSGEGSCVFPTRPGQKRQSVKPVQWQHPSLMQISLRRLPDMRWRLLIHTVASPPLRKTTKLL